MSFREKYIKYKNKYLKLKNQKGGSIDIKEYVIFLDIEFQNFNIKNKQQHFILELGLIIFKKGNIDPVLIEHINFPILSKYKRNMRLIDIQYSTVSERTEPEIIKNQNEFIIKANLEDVENKKALIKFIPDRETKDILRKALEMKDQSLLESHKTRIEKFTKKAMFNYYYERLSAKYQRLFDKQLELYNNDSLVKSRQIKPEETLLKLNSYLSKGIMVHKEGTDLEALRNTFSYYNISYDGKTKKYDIAIHNRYFQLKMTGASLYQSYSYLYEKYLSNDKTLSDEHDKLLELIKKKMSIFKPHNPLYDAFMTIFIYNLKDKLV